jgi:hypothetical protein
MPEIQPAVAITIHCVDVDCAEKALAALVAAGVPEDGVSVLARGLEVDRRLILSEEVNANRMARHIPAPPPSPLARKLASGPLLLLDGCWAAGPHFSGHASRTGRQGEEALARALLGAGISMPEATSLEARLKRDGGIWFAITCPPEAAAAARKTLEAVAGVEVGRPAA